MITIPSVTITVQKFPVEVWQQFKAQAALEGVTIRELLEQALTARIKAAKA